MHRLTPKRKVPGKAGQLARSFGFLNLDEVACLKRIARTLPPSPVVINIGAGVGTTALAVYEARPDSIIHSVDFCQEGPFGSLNGEKNAFVSAGFPPPTQYLGDSRMIGNNWQGPQSDFLIIDDGHQRHEVIGDMLVWIPHTRHNSLVAFHDYGNPEFPWIKEVVDAAFSPAFLVSSAGMITVFRIPHNEGGRGHLLEIVSML